MITRFMRTVRFFVALATLGVACQAAAQGTGYGVNGSGQLFKFDLANPNAAVTNIGAPLTFVPEGIDFRPAAVAPFAVRALYAIDVGAQNTQLYTIDITTGVPTAVGAGFPSTVAGSYNLVNGGPFGFDFNPTTLQPDNSLRIRLIGANGGVNLRLNSDTGVVSNVDTPLLYTNQNSPFADAAAYINSNRAVAAAGGTTVLYDMDSRSDQLSTQNPPNAGTLNPVGIFGAGVDAVAGIHFDILTDLGDVDPTIGGDHAYAVLQRVGVPGGGEAAVVPIGADLTYLLYNVNLTTGATTDGALVGINGGNPPADFGGGFAVTYIPEPSLAVFGIAAGLAMVVGQRRRVA
jgi:hypothetical protein